MNDNLVELNLNNGEKLPVPSLEKWVEQNRLVLEKGVPSQSQIDILKNRVNFITEGAEKMKEFVDRGWGRSEFTSYLNVCKVSLAKSAKDLSGSQFMKGMAADCRSAGEVFLALSRNQGVKISELVGVARLLASGLDSSDLKTGFDKAKQMGEEVKKAMVGGEQNIGDEKVKYLGEGERGPDPSISLVVSDEKHVRFLHRTTGSLNSESPSDPIKGIIKDGLAIGAGAIESTATTCPTDEKKALEQYHKRHKSDQQVVVVEIPRELYLKAKQRVLSENSGFGGSSGDWSSEPEISNLDMGKGGFFIKPEFIAGYINRPDGKFVANPKLKKN